MSNEASFHSSFDFQPKQAAPISGRDMLFGVSVEGRAPRTFSDHAKATLALEARLGAPWTLCGCAAESEPFSRSLWMNAGVDIEREILRRVVPFWSKSVGI